MSALARASAAALALLAAGPALAAPKALGPGERVDLNRATVAELMRLPGVGEKRARALLAFREKHPFRRPEDVLLVRGFGKAWLARARPHLVTAAPAAPAPATSAAASPAATHGPAPAPVAAAGRPAAPPKR